MTLCFKNFWPRKLSIPESSSFYFHFFIPIHFICRVIRVCMSVWNRSPQAYRELTSRGMLALPSGRLLCYYKNSIQQNAGLNKEVFELMRDEAKKWKIPKCGYRGGIVLDEMSIQEDIQMKQENGSMKLVGFTDIGEEDDAMRALKTGTNCFNVYFFLVCRR